MHERELFENVTEARSRAIDANAMPDQAQAENQITRGIRQLFAVAENHPDLKANENSRAPGGAHGDRESKIAFARQFYNDQVMLLNTLIGSFPSNVVAKTFRFAASSSSTSRIRSARRPRSSSPGSPCGRADRGEQAEDRPAHLRRDRAVGAVGYVLGLCMAPEWRLRARRGRGARSRPVARLVLRRRPSRARLDARARYHRRSNRACTTSSRGWRSRPASPSRRST